MRNYIPLKYLPVMNAVDQREISFNSSQPKAYWFGGKEGRVAWVLIVNRNFTIK